MPQLDHLTYFSQYFWLCVTFFGFYAMCVKFYLPGLSRLAKYRGKRGNDTALESHEEKSSLILASVSLPQSVRGLLDLLSGYSSFIFSLKPLSPFSSISGSLSWRRDNWSQGVKPSLKEYEYKKTCEDRRVSSLVIKNARDSAISGQTGAFGAHISSSTKSAYLDAFDFYVFQGVIKS